MDATISHDPFLPDSEAEEVDIEPTEPTEPVEHTKDKKAVAAVHELIKDGVDAHDHRVRSVQSSDAEEPAEPYDHTQDKNSIAATKKLLGRKAMADHKKKVADVAP